MKKMIKTLLSLLLMFCVALGCVACTSCISCTSVPDGMQMAKNKMNRFGYEVSDFYGNTDISGEGLKAVKKKTNTEETIIALYFQEKRDATEYYMELTEDKDNLNPDFEVKKKGHWVLIGTETAIEDFIKDTTADCLGQFA